MIIEGSVLNLKQYFSYHVPDLEDLLYSIEYNPRGTRFSFDKFGFLISEGGKITKECSIKACEKGNIKVFIYICENSPEMVDEDCLIYAIKNNQKEIVKYILESGICLKPSINPFSICDPNNNSEIYKILIDHISLFEEKYQDEVYMLDMYNIKWETLMITGQTKDLDYIFNTRCETTHNLYQLCIQYDRLDLVKHMIEIGKYVSYSDMIELAKKWPILVEEDLIHKIDLQEEKESMKEEVKQVDSKLSFEDKIRQDILPIIEKVKKEAEVMTVGSKCIKYYLPFGQHFDMLGVELDMLQIYHKISIYLSAIGPIGYTGYVPLLIYNH